MKQLSEYLGEARIGRVRSLPYRIEVTVDMDFGPFVPSGQDGDWLATAADVKAFRDGFKEYLRTESKTLKLSNLFYLEYLAFIRAHMGIYRFGKNVVRQLPKTAERRLAGRPKHSLSRSDIQILKNEIEVIKSTLLEMKKSVRQWNSERLPSKEHVIKERIRDQYPRERYLWMKFFFGCFKKLPRSRRNPLGGRFNKRLSKTASWSAVDLALLIVKESYYRRMGIELPIQTLRTLIPDSKLSKNKRICDQLLPSSDVQP